MFLQPSWTPYDHFLYKKLKMSNVKRLRCQMSWCYQATGSSSIFYVHNIVELKINKHKIWKMRLCVEACCYNLHVCFINYNRWDHNTQRAGNSCPLLCKERQQLAGWLCVWNNFIWQVKGEKCCCWWLCEENHWEASSRRPKKNKTFLRYATSEVLVYADTATISVRWPKH